MSSGKSLPRRVWVGEGCSCSFDSVIQRSDEKLSFSTPTEHAAFTYSVAAEDCQFLISSEVVSNPSELWKVDAVDQRSS